MLETTKKLYEEMDTMMETLVRKTMLDAFMNMDADEIVLMQNMFKMYDFAKELAIKQAEIIEEQNNKLDKILRLLEKRSL